MKRTVVDALAQEQKGGSAYPEEFRREVMGRTKARLGDLFDLTQFGVNITTLAPGSWSSHRHWHEAEDEFIYVLSGEVTLVDDDGAHVMTPGMCAGFKAGKNNGHHIQNNTDVPAIYLEVGTRAAADRVTYSDVNLSATKVPGEGWRFGRGDFYKSQI